MQFLIYQLINCVIFKMKVCAWIVLCFTQRVGLFILTTYVYLGLKRIIIILNIQQNVTKLLFCLSLFLISMLTVFLFNLFIFIFVYDKHNNLFVYALRWILLNENQMWIKKCICISYLIRKKFSFVDCRISSEWVLEYSLHHAKV